MSIDNNLKFLLDIIEDEVITEILITNSDSVEHKHSIIKNYGALSDRKSPPYFALVNWYGYKRYDIRRWNKDFTIAYKGISLTYDDIVMLHSVFKNPENFHKSENQHIYNHGKGKAVIQKVIVTLSTANIKGETWNKQVCVVDWGSIKGFDFRRWTSDYSKCSRGICLNKIEMNNLLNIIGEIYSADEE